MDFIKYFSHMVVVIQKVMTSLRRFMQLQSEVSTVTLLTQI